MDNKFIVLRIDPTNSGGNYQTIGPCAEGQETFELADAEARALSRQYPQGSFAVFQRRATYNTSILATRRLDRKLPQPQSNVMELKAGRKSAKAAG